MATDEPFPTFCKHMQHLLKDHVCHLRQELEADTVQKTGRLELPEAENKLSLPGMWWK